MSVFFLSLICMMPLLSHPLPLGFCVLFISCFASMILSKFFASWFGYSLFLVFVGGVLVMFSYVAALSPNLSGFNFNFFFGLGVCFFIINFILVNLFDLSSFLGFFSYDYFGSSKLLSLVSGLFFYKNILLMLFLLIMLLGTMMMVVKICYYYGGPLRPFYMKYV
uniref:NADH dehydrogenase subunit 6 n=1 Tax=Loxocorone allax TaxID=393181 RepID=B1B1W6_LOXAA|nr:NADH dehydrogenase subunit 6 [Loxocorone allax]BAG12581.1 NADH dehydrogenase subunit 6 [Loxocorone allax]